VGYWQVHSDLFQHTKGGNSVFTSVTHQPTSFVGSLFFQTERGLYSIFGNVMDIRKEQQHFVWEGYFLDLESKVWNSVEFDLNENFKEQFGAETFQQNWGIGGQFETADFAGIEIGTPILKPGWLIFDKRTSKLYVKEFNQSFLVGGSLQWTLIKGNTITVFPKYDLTPIEFDVEELVATAIPVGEIRVSDEVPQSEENRLEVDGTHLLLIFLNLIVLAALGGTIYYQKKKSIPLYQQGSSPSAEITGWTKKLEEFQGLVVTQETMDELLGIQGQKNPDIRKVSRSRAIRSINEQSEKETGHPLISRERDYRDKRVILYRVGVLKKTKSGTKQEVEIHSSYQ
jgi:hypothetical protein